MTNASHTTGDTPEPPAPAASIASSPSTTSLTSTTAPDAATAGGTDAIADAPTAADPCAWRPLPARIRTVWLVNEAIVCAAWLAACGIFTAICMANHWWGFWTQLTAGLATAYAVLDLVTQPLQSKYLYAFTRFRLGEHDLATRKGWLFRRSTTTPYNRVQHVDTRQNPVQRRFGLTTVVVYTAADEHEIAALDTAEAERMVALIAVRVASAKEDL
ncbi:PH domain-containing protein [Bifidobacterium sp. CP2]|uniref:PH domain-containing protein n=1 Tax=Bifidobacterium sp. CP2 TaxID=2809025 RepID=UPI001BDD5F9F|nr:PH domain-containing protein [Bifidobacterium sp. CP2]MBT1180714.1 PH domain-containing protein [Bifidobacterium sp. CP2]